MHTEQFCFTNESNSFNKTIINVCVKSASLEVTDEVSLKLNIIGNHHSSSDIWALNNFIFTAIGISTPFLLATLFVYAFLPELRNVHGKCFICYMGSLLIFYIFIVYGQVVNQLSESLLCKFVGYGSYFFATLCFFWLNVICYDIWSTFR